MAMRRLGLLLLGFNAGLIAAAALVKQAFPSRGDTESESSVRTLAGGVDVKVPEPEGPAAPTLTIDGLAGFGGIAIGAKADD
jgi:hypothetical protein